jgi:hypothetical protein
MKIGNWLIKDNGILWQGPVADSFIPSDELLEIINEGDIKVYNWLVHFNEKKWSNENDIYSLNIAFILAAEKYNIKIDFGILLSTLLEQNKLINHN